MRSWLDIDERLLFIYSALFGLACGYLSNHGVLSGSWTNLILWALIGVLLGFFANDSRTALTTGSIYGFFLTTSFLYLGYQGSPDSIASFIGLSVVLALVGIGCGIVCVQAGRFIAHKFIRSS